MKIRKNVYRLWYILWAMFYYSILLRSYPGVQRLSINNLISVLVKVNWKILKLILKWNIIKHGKSLWKLFFNLVEHIVLPFS